VSSSRVPSASKLALTHKAVKPADSAPVQVRPQPPKQPLCTSRSRTRAPSAAEATDRLDDDHGLSQLAVATNLARFRRPIRRSSWLHRHSWEQLDRYARGMDRTPRERLTGVIATYLAAMVRTHGGECAARRAHEPRPGG
jgi:hypothetical protein